KVEYQVTAAAPWDPGNPVHAYNPLGKLPVLILDDGTHLYDSRVIVEYIDLVSPVSRLIPEPARQRIAVKKWEALADGVCDATAAIVGEPRRPTPLQSDDWIDRQRRKIREGVADLSRELGDRAWCHGESYSLADIATGCALGYLDLRHAELDWREPYPNLERLADKLCSRSSFDKAAAEGSSRHRALGVPRYSACFNCSRIAGFSSVETSSVIASSFAIERSSRRMILADRVLGRFSPKRMSFGFAIGPISLPTQSRSCLAIASASLPLGRALFSTTNAQTASPVRPSGRPTTAASATIGFDTSADSISIVPSRWPDTL